MTLNHINFIVGLLAGLALGLLLHPKPEKDRDDNVHVMHRPLRKAAGK